MGLKSWLIKRIRWPELNFGDQIIKMEDESTYKPPAQVWIILLYIVGCVGVVVLGFLLTPQILPLIGNFGAAKEPLWNMGLWGSLGAIISTLYSLWAHISVYKDHDRSHAVWCFINPPAGFIMGVLSGIVFANFLPYVFTRNTPALKDTTPFLLYLFAFVAGFHRTTILNWLRQQIKQIFSPKDK